MRTILALSAVVVLGSCQAPLFLTGTHNRLALEIVSPASLNQAGIANATKGTTSRLLSGWGDVISISIIRDDTGESLFNGPAELQDGAYGMEANVTIPNIPLGRALTISVTATYSGTGKVMFQAVKKCTLSMANTTAPVKIVLAPTTENNLLALNCDNQNFAGKDLLVKKNSVSFVVLTVPDNLVGKTTRLCWNSGNAPVIGNISNTQGDFAAVSRMVDKSGLTFVPTSAGIWYVSVENNGTADFTLSNINYGLNEYFYYTAPGYSNIYWARLNSATGNLTIPTSNSISVTMTPSQIAIDPNGKYLYASYAKAGQVYVYSINPIDGSLIALSYNTGITSPNLITVFPDGLHVTVTNNSASDPTVYSLIFDKNSIILTQTGNVNTYVSGQPITGMVFNPIKNLLYVINQGSTSQTSQFLSTFAVAPNSFTLSKLFNYGNGTISNEIVSSIVITPDYQYILMSYFSDATSSQPIYSIFNNEIDTPGNIVNTSRELILNTKSDNLSINPNGDLVVYRLGGNTLYYIQYSQNNHSFITSSNTVLGTGFTRGIFDVEGKFIYAVNNSMPVGLFPINRTNGNVSLEAKIDIFSILSVNSALTGYLR